MRKTIFRVEHSTHVEPGDSYRSGPYNPGSSNRDLYDFGWVLKWAHNGDEHPSPADSGMCFPQDIIDGAYIFGFYGLDDVYTWFDGWLGRLALKGYIVAEYSIDDDKIINGRRQLAFRPEDATHVQDWSLRKDVMLYQG